ncbi:MAG: hypothetical protein RBU29_13495, partial [bacterium]|nr:hypothetical protein [bacterium]
MNRFVSCLLCCVLILCAVPAVLSQSLSFGKAAPPIPGSIIGKIHGLGHPFLLASRDHFRETRQLMHQEVNLPRNKRFLHRVNQYNKKDSPWYVGEGPLSTNENFHPAFLPEADFLFYTKVIIETLIFYGIEHDRWVETACTAEFLRLLDEMEFGLVVNPDSLEDAFITPRQASLLAITTLIKDMYFRRFETLERHDYTARYKAQRDQLALACASADLNGFPAYQRAMLGTALGLSSLLCIAIHPVEWRRDGAVAVESFLPDLYRAVNLTRDGYHDLLSDDGRITCTFEELELLVMLSSPWIECMKALGYPYCLEADEYSRLVTGLEMHRIKGTHNILEPMDLGRVTTPWIPKTSPLYIADNMALYPKTTLPTMNPMLATAREPQMAPEDEKIDEILQGDLSSLPSPQQPAPLDSGANLRPTRMTLREQLEKFGLPRAPAPAQTKDSTDMVVTVEPGWFAPPTVILPRALNFLYQQAAKENPASK